jgi:hypothetical protein
MQGHHNASTLRHRIFLFRYKACAICHSSTMMSRLGIAMGNLIGIFSGQNVRLAIALAALSAMAAAQAHKPTQRGMLDAWFNSQQRRRSEIYMDFNLAPEARVFHLMGPSEQTRHLVVKDHEAVVSQDGRSTSAWERVLTVSVGAWMEKTRTRKHGSDRSHKSVLAIHRRTK